MKSCYFKVAEFDLGGLKRKNSDEGERLFSLRATPY